MARLKPILFVCMLFLASCQARPTVTPTPPGVSMRGHISQVNPPDSRRGLSIIRVEGSKVDPSIPRAMVTVTEDTEVYLQQGDKLLARAAGDLEVGQLVHINFAGPVMESDPVQGTAARIIIEATAPRQ